MRILENFQPALVRKQVQVLTLAALAIAAVAWATPSMGFLVNQILAMGATTENISQQVQMARDPEVGDDPWQVQVQAQGATDFYVHQLAVAPGGYSGWHTHPGVLIGTVVSGSLDFYDSNCQKKTYTAGQVFLENSQTHGIINTGTVNTELTIAYLVKHKAARRIDASAPACAASTPIP